jgi:DNA-binding transcriptional ArsR family regulator
MTNLAMIDGASGTKKAIWQDDASVVPRANPSLVAEGQRLLGTEGLYADLAEVFRALADPSRAKIVHSLLNQELCTCDLAAIVSLSEPGVSQHLRVLRNLRVVKARRAGRRVFYSLDDAHVRELLSLSLSHLGHSAANKAPGA